MKKNIICFILGGIIFSTTLVSGYQLLAKDISYTPNWTKENGDNITNVEEAIDELYDKTKYTKVIGEETWSSGGFENYSNGIGKSQTFSVNKGVNKIKIYVSVTSTWGDINPSIEGNIIKQSSIKTISSVGFAGSYVSDFYEIIAETTGEAGTFKLNISTGPAYGSSSGRKFGNAAFAHIIYER